MKKLYAIAQSRVFIDTMKPTQGGVVLFHAFSICHSHLTNARWSGDPGLSLGQWWETLFIGTWINLVILTIGMTALSDVWGPPTH